MSDVLFPADSEEQEVLIVHLGELGGVWEEELEGSCVILKGHQLPLHFVGLLGIGLLHPHPRDEVAIELRKHLLCFPRVEYKLIEFDSQHPLPVDPDGYHTDHPLEPALVPFYLRELLGVVLSDLEHEGICPLLWVAGVVVREHHLEAVEAHKVHVHGCDTELPGEWIESNEVRQHLGHSAMAQVIDLQGPTIIVRVLDIGQFESLVRLQTNFHYLFKLADK